MNEKQYKEVLERLREAEENERKLTEDLSICQLELEELRAQVETQKGTAEAYAMAKEEERRMQAAAAMSRPSSIEEEHRKNFRKPKAA